MESPSEKAALLDALLAGVHDGVVVTDDVGTILRASPSMERILGWSPAALVGENVRALVPPPHRDGHDGYMARYRETGHTWILGSVREFDVVSADGGTVRCELCVSRVDVGPAGSRPLFSGVFRDVTERVRARERLAASEAKFRAIFENENQLVLLLDAAGRIVEANGPTYARTGASSAQLVGRVLDEARFWSDPRANRDRVARTLADAYAGGLATCRAEVDVLERQEGADLRMRARPHGVSIRTLDGDGEGMPRALVEVRDISDLVAAEERERAIERSLAQVGEEAAVLAHELRSPVSELELALKALARQLGAEERTLLDGLARRMRRLEALLTRTLSFSRPLELHPARVAAHGALRQATEREAAVLKAHGTRVDLGVPPGEPLLLEADPAALDDLLSNLVRNAAEAQRDEPAGGVVRLRAEPLGARHVRLVVEDEGPGIPPERHEDVFRVFYTDKPGGTGFGLALVRKIAEAHGAEVRLRSGAGGLGLRVELDWPRAR